MVKNGICYIMIGLPCSGKSMWATRLKVVPHSFVYSTDAYIQDYAKINNKTYNEVWASQIKTATYKMDTDLACYLDAFANKKIDYAHIIWDQTNVTVAKRTYILNKLPPNIHKVAVYFRKLGLNTFDERNNRPGKIIPAPIYNSMYDSYVYPTKDEGFDEIVMIDTSV